MFPFLLGQEFPCEVVALTLSSCQCEGGGLLTTADFLSQIATAATRCAV